MTVLLIDVRHCLTMVKKSPYYDDAEERGDATGTQLERPCLPPNFPLNLLIRII